MGKDFYAILGINRGASDVDLQHSYRKLALKFHPVKNESGGADEKFAEVAEAYDILSNPIRRATFDKFGEEGLRAGVSTAEGGFLDGYSFHGDAYKVFADFFGCDNPFKELFINEEVAGSSYPKFGGLKGRSQPKQDPPIERDLMLTLEEVYNGCIKKMEISRKVLNDDGFTTSTRKKIVTITVKRGWREGTRITFPKEGDQGPNRVPADIVFVLKHKPHPTLIRDGDNLIFSPEIPLIKALCGGNVQVHTLDNRIITIPITEVISPGNTKCVVCEGMPVSDEPSQRGDLLIQFRIAFPPSLSPHQQSLIRQALQ
ncbi:DnaJ homolog subfamily B member 13 [Geodia barretti]|nr:DnaJ homolog subfamily B member 13 [Geodia barretti]